MQHGQGGGQIARVRRRARQQHIGIPGQGGQWCAQFVGGIVDKALCVAKVSSHGRSHGVEGDGEMPHLVAHGWPATRRGYCPPP